MMTSMDHPASLIRARSGLVNTTKEMSQSQKALELRKFFAPSDPQLESEDSCGFNVRLNGDGALDSFAENALWRLGAVRCMISLIDRGTQYFIAGAARIGGRESTEMKMDGKWFGCSAIPTPGGLCEHTIEIVYNDQFPCFQIEDLSQHPDYSDLAVVNGELASYRFYAGTPITTNLDVNIGSFFIFGDEARPGGLKFEQRKYLWKLASNIMKHLETQREAAERKRVALMSKGIARFLEKTSKVTQDDITANGDIVNRAPSGTAPPKEPAGDSTRQEDEEEGQEENSKESFGKPNDNSPQKTLDKIKVTLDHAANILRESLELTVGGVVFLDLARGHKQAGITDAPLDANTDLGSEVADQTARLDGDETRPTEGTLTQRNGPHSLAAHQKAGRSTSYFRDSKAHLDPAKILAMSAAKSTQWEISSDVMDGKTLQTFINKYPQGNVWYIDDEGYFSSLDQARQNAQDPTAAGKARKVSTTDIIRQQAEASLLIKIFKKARQVVFVPLWDAGSDRWHSGCFVWSRSAVPVFTVDSEISFLSAFTNSLMVEISRLDAITANRMKSDFISSISHEFRSPLHGILASAEFLRESELEPTQTEFVSTIQNCGSTLLDTINHVLDYSKINSFEKAGAEGAISNELHQVSNIALLCEEIVSGMVAASEYQGMQHAATSAISNHDHFSNRAQVGSIHEPIEIILDIEPRNWNFKTQPGAIRRVLMNIFGNAQKYTSSGFILVQLRVRDTRIQRKEPSKPDLPRNTPNRTLLLNVIDSGRGMSTEYMERKLYTPFAQEDTFANGVGLGLSIVWSIVSQLGGKIQVHSEVGKGTDVEISIPLHEDAISISSLEDCEEVDEFSGVHEAEQNLIAMKKIANGKSIAIWQDPKAHIKSSRSVALDCLESYCSDWYGFSVFTTNAIGDVSPADLIIAEQMDNDLQDLRHSKPDHINKLLLIQDNSTWRQTHKATHGKLNYGNIQMPVGPFKLARSILSLFKTEEYVESTVSSRPGLAPIKRSDTGTQTSTLSTSASNDSLPSDQAVQNGTRGGKEVRSSSQTSNHNETLINTHTRAISSPRVSSPAQDDEEGTKIPDISSLSLKDQASRTSDSRKETLSDTPSQVPLRLLAVDDNDVNLQLICRFLKKRKTDIVDTARDGLEALNAVKHLHDSSKGSQSFDIIFMDISMPVMDGFESTAAIREFELQTDQQPSSEKSMNQDQNSPRKSKRSMIVALTGLGSRRDRDRAEQCGFDDFVTKPVSFKKVGELVQRVSTERSVVTE